MITPKQQRWLDHLSDEKKINIVPYDPSCKEKYEKIKEKIQKRLGKNIKVFHRGASSLGISGQDEIDVYIPVSKETFNSFIPKLEKLFGKARSIYPLERARFHAKIDGKKIDLFLINKMSEGWLSGVKFESYLKKHPKDLEEYMRLKENGDGLSVREYYSRKNEFINFILAKARV